MGRAGSLCRSRPLCTWIPQRRISTGQSAQRRLCDPRMMIRRHYWFSGRVQGVGFRYKAYYIARSLGVTGWVRNNWDDRVEMEAQGTGEDLDQMVQMLNEQHFICIENIEMETIEIEEEHSFYVK